MKPNPLSALNHLTVPVAMFGPPCSGAANAEEAKQRLRALALCQPEPFARTALNGTGMRRRPSIPREAATLLARGLGWPWRPRRKTPALFLGHLAHRQRSVLHLALDLVQLLLALLGSAVSLRSHLAPSRPWPRALRAPGAPGQPRRRAPEPPIAPRWSAAGRRPWPDRSRSARCGSARRPAGLRSPSC